MSGADLDRIETALGLRLPTAYRAAMVPFPAPDAAGNADAPVWDDADALIALNRRLRAEVPEWPGWLFAVGQSEGDPSGWAIDTRGPDAPLWWLERMRPGPASGPWSGPFGEWLWAVAVDLNEPPTPPGQGGRMLVAWAVLSAVVVALFWLWVALGVRTAKAEPVAAPDRRGT